MALTVEEARRRLRATLARVAPEATLDTGAVRRVETPYPAFAYGLRLGQANALLFMPVADIDGEEWEERLPRRLTEAYHYLDGFPLAAAGRGPRSTARRRRGRG